MKSRSFLHSFKCLKALFHSSQKPTRKIAARTFIQSQYLKLESTRCELACWLLRWVEKRLKTLSREQKVYPKNAGFYLLENAYNSLQYMLPCEKNSNFQPLPQEENSMFQSMDNSWIYIELWATWSCFAKRDLGIPTEKHKKYIICQSASLLDHGADKQCGYIHSEYNISK